MEDCAARLVVPQTISTPALYPRFIRQLPSKVRRGAQCHDTSCTSDIGMSAASVWSYLVNGFGIKADIHARHVTVYKRKKPTPRCSRVTASCGRLHVEIEKDVQPGNLSCVAAVWYLKRESCRLGSLCTTPTGYLPTASIILRTAAPFERSMIVIRFPL